MLSLLHKLLESIFSQALTPRPAELLMAGMGSTQPLLRETPLWWFKPSLHCSANPHCFFLMVCKIKKPLQNHCCRQQGPCGFHQLVVMLMIYIEKEIIFNKRAIFVLCMRLSPSLHSLSVCCCRESVTGWAGLSFPLLSGSCLGLEQLKLPWGWSCHGAGAALGLELPWGWPFPPAMR